MCTTCGCGSDEVSIHKAGEHHHHHHNHSHENEREIKLEKDILYENNLLAERNRGYFQALGILSLNLVSSPGSGKTTVLERTIKDLKDEYPISVIEGDQQTMNDANRIKEAGAEAIQINTGKGCHLDAHMIVHAIEKLRPKNQSLLFIENVGNLVCPAMFDLGESKRVVIISVTEGDDKPAKYPTMFETADLCLINKSDLLPYVPFDVDKVKSNALKVNPNIKFITVSALHCDGMEDWYQWLRNLISKKELNEDMAHSHNG